MTKSEALTILVRNSFLIPDEKKEDLISAISAMSGPEIDALGKFLAAEQKDAAASREDMLKRIDLLLAELEKDKESGT